MLGTRWTKWQRLGGVALAGGALLVAACGGDIDSGSSSRAEFDDASREAPAGAPEEPVDGTTLGAAELGGGESLEQPQVQDRKIVRNATLELQVESVVEGVQQIDDIAGASGGFVSSSNVFVESDGTGADVQRTQTASVTIRVPADAYSSVMGQLRGIARETVSETSDASEVTEEYTDLQARQRNLEATEARYIELLNRAATIDEILTVQDRLNQVRLEIEQVSGRINVLNNLTDFATITARLSLPPAVAQSSDNGNWAEEAWQASWETSQDAMVALGTVAIVSGVLTAWLAVPALALFFIWRLFGGGGSQSSREARRGISRR